MADTKATTSGDSCCGSGSSCCPPPTTTSKEDESLESCPVEERPLVVAQGHDNHHDRHHHGLKTTTTVTEQDDVQCLAIVPEDGKTIAILDASGSVRSFAYKGGRSSSKGGGGNVRNLCFSSHGTDTATDDLLTPCFDHEGNHGMPDEGCFCGVDIPHLHAHLYDPKLCNNNNNEKGPKKSNMASSESNLITLASLTLLPVNDKTGGGDSEDRFLQIPVSEHMPSECKSKDLLLSHRSRSNETKIQNRRMYPVKVSESV
jgi:hypothetical protein